MSDEKRPYTRHKRQDKFRLILPPCKDFPGGTYDEYGFSPQHALSNSGRKLGYLHLVDDYFLMLENENPNPNIDVQLETGGTYRTVKYVPKLKELREFVIDKTENTRTEIYNMKYSTLKNIWDRFVNKPVASVPEAVSTWIREMEEKRKKEERNMQYELF